VNTTCTKVKSEAIYNNVQRLSHSPAMPVGFLEPTTIGFSFLGLQFYFLNPTQRILFL
jgi:hypothetical protein